MTLSKYIDHIVCAVPNLEAACGQIEALLGVRPKFGGYHQNHGTKNALLNLGGGCYFELLAIDENNTRISAPRWMGVDLVEKPTITRWAVKSTSVVRDAEMLTSIHSDLGKVSAGERRLEDGNLLVWELSLPLPEPEVEVLPFFINWENSSHHPTDRLPEKCKLLGLEILHPDPASVLPFFQKLKIDVSVLEGDSPRIKVVVDSPNGMVEI